MRRVSLNDVYSYIIGNLRYYLYYNYPKLLPKHIKEQYEFRLLLMDKECYNNGSCKMCGCKTTALQMADKECDKPCYPPFLSKKDWYRFKEGLTVTCKGHSYFKVEVDDIMVIFKDKEMIVNKYV